VLPDSWLTARVEALGFRTESGVVARLVIDRVEKRNALTRSMWEALPGLLAELAADDEVKVLLITGATRKRSPEFVWHPG